MENRVKNPVLAAVAVDEKNYPPPNLHEIAFAGRSNVGKSSLLNRLTNRKKLAHVSGNPGKTRTINFYDVDGLFRIVDLPGYGYARVSKSKSEEWGKMIERYIETRDNLVAVAMLVDIRHDPGSLDLMMADYLRYHGYKLFVVATKSDKLSRNQIKKHLQNIRKKLELDNDEAVLPVSSLSGEGCDLLMDYIFALGRGEKI